MVPVDACADSIPILSWVLMIENPIEWNYTGVEFAHKILAYVVHTVLVLCLTHLRYVQIFGPVLG